MKLIGTLALSWLLSTIALAGGAARGEHGDDELPLEPTATRRLAAAVKSTSDAGGRQLGREDDDDDDDEEEEEEAEVTSSAADGAERAERRQRTTSTSRGLRSPYFEDTVGNDGDGDGDGDGLNVTSQLGNDVTLHCRVHNLSDKVVSWLRRAGDGMQLLWYDRQAYISDGRYEMQFREPNDWQLRIRYANERDEGHYQCQVSSHPPLVSRIYLKIQVPQLHIADERESPIRYKFYDVGSTIQLRCVIGKVRRRADAPVTWRHGSRILNYDTFRGGINVKTEILADGARSRLFVANARPSDSGNYTCSLADEATAYVTVQVLNGERPAAIQRGGSSNHGGFHRLAILLAMARVADAYR